MDEAIINFPAGTTGLLNNRVVQVIQFAPSEPMMWRQVGGTFVSKWQPRGTWTVRLSEESTTLTVPFDDVTLL